MIPASICLPKCLASTSKMIGVQLRDSFLNLGIRYDRDIDTYGIAQTGQQPHPYRRLFAASQDQRCQPSPHHPNAANLGVGYTPSLGYLGGDYTGLPKNDNLDLSPRIGFRL